MQSRQEKRSCKAVIVMCAIINSFYSVDRCGSFMFITAVVPIPSATLNMELILQYCRG